ncbi:hypothetical protein [Anaerotignum sp.]|uniref:hypothetical protein n=1 Tax=Anaerotignum sp. TaxID=2039241 RepID=UPI0028A9F3F2|nr:hypothetical protein [Anaerotignum sp.]
MIRFGEWKREWLKLPVVLTIAGVLLFIINFIVPYVMMASGTNEWTVEMGNTVFYIDMVISLILFLTIGFVFCRNISRKVLLKSAHFLLIYYVAIIILEQGAQKLGVYTIGMVLLFLPFEIFAFLVRLMSIIFGSVGSIMFYIIPISFAAYLFVPFGIKDKIESE